MTNEQQNLLNFTVRLCLDAVINNEFIDPEEWTEEIQAGLLPVLSDALLFGIQNNPMAILPQLHNALDLAGYPKDTGLSVAYRVKQIQEEIDNAPVT